MSLRAIHKDGQPWFVAADVCDALELPPTPSNGYASWLRGLDEDERTHTQCVGVFGGVHPKSALINESGLYSLILRSRKPEAKAFKKWVTSVVLPAIRKEGMYVADSGVKSEPKW